MKSVGIDGTKATTIRLQKLGPVVTTPGEVLPLTNLEKRRRFLKGAERLFAPTEAMKVLQRDHDLLTEVEGRLAAKRVDHVQPLAKKAGAALFRALGKDCFLDADQASTWARQYLPLSDAWGKVKADEDALSRDRNMLKDLRGQFWQGAGDLALKIAKHAGGDQDQAVFEVSTMGSWG